MGVEDQSDGCGGKFAALIVSKQFEGKKLLERHRWVSKSPIRKNCYLWPLASGYIMYKLYNQENFPVPVPVLKTKFAMKGHP